MSVQVDPISRIEGHLGVEIELNGAGDLATGANVHGNLWRGFENFLIGREPNDAITFTQRICGVCPLPHATASTFAIDSVLGYSDKYITFAQTSTSDAKGVPPKAVHVRNLVYSAEFLMSHITHFYHLVALSYVQGPPIAPWTPYFASGWYSPYLTSSSNLPTGNSIWDAVVRQYVKALRIRRLTFEAGALFAGRMPMTSSFVAGGVTLQDDSVMFAAKCDKFAALMAEVGRFIIHEHIPLVLALGFFYPDYDNGANVWLSGATADTSPGIGGGLGNFLAWGAFPHGGYVSGGADASRNILLIGGGTKLAGSAASLMVTSRDGTEDGSGLPVSGACAQVEARLIEDTACSRYVAASGWGYATASPTGTVSYAYPGVVNRTEPIRSDEDKYSWIKAPRWKGADNLYHAMEVGPFARMAVNGWYPVDYTTLIAAKVPRMAALYSDGTTIKAGMVSPDLASGIIADTDAATLNALLLMIHGLKGGLSTMDRLRARALECLVLIEAMIGQYTPNASQTGAFASGTSWIGAAKGLAGASNYRSKQVPVTRKVGYGVSEAPRGALAHFCTIDKGVIAAYQCVVPTTWNGSPKDSQGAGFATTLAGAGPIEAATIGSPYAGGTTPGVEALRIAQSFDPCIACAIH